MHQLNPIPLFILALSLSLPTNVAESSTSQGDVWGQAKQALYQGEWKSVGEIFYNQLKTEAKGRNLPYASYAEIMLGKGEEAIALISCIVLDMLTLVEREFGQNGQTFSKQMQIILADIERLKPQELSKPGTLDNVAYQKAHQKGSRSAHLTCKQVNQAYGALKKEVRTLFSPLAGKSVNKEATIPPAVLENMERTFYYSALSTRYERVAKKNENGNKINWKPLD
ncbi:MAG: hypothetical protein HY559_01070 [Gammaproteobacteria bacterium]|nr:hypothetical protein [Gammaproteobacteria bacterium]